MASVPGAILTTDADGGKARIIAEGDGASIGTAELARGPPEPGRALARRSAGVDDGQIHAAIKRAPRRHPLGLPPAELSCVGNRGDLHDIPALLAGENRPTSLCQVRWLFRSCPRAARSAAWLVAVRGRRRHSWRSGGYA